MRWLRQVSRRAVVVVTVVMAGLGAMLPASPVRVPILAGARGLDAAERSVTVSPSTGIADGQTLTVTGTGLASDTAVTIAFCPEGATSLDGCDPSTVRASPDGGAFVQAVPARAILRLEGTEHDCRRREGSQGCVLGVELWDRTGTEVVWLPVEFDFYAPLLPPPTLTVSPDEALVDGQTVTVTGNGFAYQPEVLIAQCVAGTAFLPGDCDAEMSTTVPLVDQGFEVDTPVFASIVTDDHGSVDCREAGRCVLTATEIGDPTPAALAPLTFNPDGPLPDPPTVTLTPATDLLDGQLVQVEGRGFRQPGDLVSLYQCTPSANEERCATASDDSLQIGDDGTFQAEVVLAARIPTPDGRVDCRTTPEPCLLIASTSAVDDPRAVRTALHFDPDGPLLPDPAVSLSPDADLHDFTDLAVTGRQFTPGGRVTVHVCPTGTDSPDRCDDDNAEWPTADADGGIATVIAGWATFTPPWATDGPVDCRQPPGCEIVATDEARHLSARAPLAFGPPDEPRGRYLDPVFDEVDVDHDVLYRETLDHHGNPVELTMDIYRPAGDTVANRPAVVWMHGGWFIFGDKSEMADMATEVARRGFVGVSLQYRLRRDLSTGDTEGLRAAALDAYDDATAGVEWLQAHAAEYGINPDAIAAGGFSAGAVTAFNLAYMPGQRGPATPRIAAALPAAGLLMPEAEPDAGEPPSIIFHGTDDEVLPTNNADTVCPQVEPLGITCELVAYDGEGHVMRRRDVIRRGLDFLAEHLLAVPPIPRRPG